MSVAVIGAVFVDCKAFAPENYIPEGRNIGTVQIKHGGVARNVVENIARLGCETKFISCVDKSPLGASVEARLKENRVDLTYMSYDSGIGIWSVILDKHGKQLGAVSHVPELSGFESYYRKNAEEILRSCDNIALEIDFSMDVTVRTLEIAKKYNKKVYGVISNLGILEQLKSRLSDFEFFVCNEIEAARIFGINTQNITPEKMYELVSEKLGMYNMTQIIVTMGSKGAVYISKDNGWSFVPSKKVSPLDTTGAGDAFFSGVVASLDKGLDIKQAMEVGTRLASQTICVDENTCIPSSDIFDNL